MRRGPSLPWPDARARARAAGRPLPAVSRTLHHARDHVLARPLTALTDLPPFDTSAMDGWAVAGPGPWRVRGRLLAGDDSDAVGTLADGDAVEIATGARLPRGATGVLRGERSKLDERLLFGDVQQGGDVRAQGQECRSGDELLPAGTAVTPGVAGLAAAAGYDELIVVDRPRVEVLVLGDELLESGPPRDGRVRDALGPLLTPWLRELGSDVRRVRRVGDDLPALRQAVEASRADVVITTGGTAGGPVDHVHPLLRELRAELLVDGVAVRPGHPMALAHLPGPRPGAGRFLVALPGNPLAAVSGMLTLAVPLLRRLSGRPASRSRRVRVAAAVTGHPYDTRLVPLAGDTPLHFSGPAMLRGFAVADGMAVVPPGGLRAGDRAEVLRVPR
ncbi:molybdopterin molybdotransferase MoeA [Yinghuangia sp. ASG 101]|uniref:molybdopterin molybdotransferase MoeA n=1 Tax=Yinghuangia sp. ASG 101 TaxID=2896848 RepID=UPI001E4637EC|nr:molybdopterin molybdotransferase MoeA [Yinghuangia sp. ASG 101]UGQ15234.1 molybdopterin molybdotransferase MoeA [Yinghuangia sp. ASG 101]